MRNFNSDRGGFKNFSDRGFGGGNRGSSFGGNRGGFDRNRNDRQMFDAVCDKCGQNCQVPFQPTGEKPVYCSNCFEKTSGREGGNRDFGGNNRRFESRNTKDYSQYNNTRAELEIINQKIDKVLSILNFQKVSPIVEKKTVKKVKKTENQIEIKE